MITRNTKLLVIAVISVTASVTSTFLATTYMQQVAIAQNGTGSTGAVSLNNLTGSVQVFPGLSQTIQSKVKIGQLLQMLKNQLVLVHMLSLPMLA